MAKKVLIVEDFEDVRSFLKFYLEKEGLEVVEAVTGREAVMMANDAPQLILMDINLPEMDGLSATRLIKENPTAEKIPIVVLTASPINQVYDDAIKAGCHSVLSKPVNYKDLKKVINLID